MNATLNSFMAAFLLLLFVQPADAHCLVFRCKSVLGKRSSATSAGDLRVAEGPQTSSLLLVVDLEKEYQERNWNPDPALNTKTDSIVIDEGASKTFDFTSGKSPYSKADSGWMKFGFFKSGSYFYLFHVGMEDFGLWGMDYGSLTASGPCTSSPVNIGGANRSIRIPMDFSATQHRADNGIFKTNIVNVSVDLVMTKAVNDHLYQQGAISGSGSATTGGVPGGVYDTTSVVSEASAKAMDYLFSTYLPAAGYTRKVAQ